MGDQEPDALAWPGLQEPEVSAVGQCSWLPAPQPGQHQSRSICWAQARAPAAHTWPTRCGRSLELKPWLATTLRPELEAALPFLRPHPSRRQLEDLLQRTHSYKVQLWLQLPKLQTQVTSPKVMTANCPPFSELRALAHGLAH